MFSSIIMRDNQINDPCIALNHTQVFENHSPAEVSAGVLMGTLIYPTRTIWKKIEIGVMFENFTSTKKWKDKQGAHHPGTTPGSGSEVRGWWLSLYLLGLAGLS